MPKGRVGGRAPECGAPSWAGVKAEEVQSVGDPWVTGDFYRAFSVHDQSWEFNEKLSHTAAMFLYKGKAREKSFRSEEMCTAAWPLE